MVLHHRGTQSLRLCRLVLVLLLSVCVSATSALREARVQERQAQDDATLYTATFYSTTELREAVDLYLTHYEEYSVDGSNSTTASGELEYLLQTYGPIEEWKTQRVRDFSNLFNAKLNAQAANASFDLSKWDVSNADSMIDMFLDTEAFNFDFSQWNVARVVRFNGMFDGALALEGRGLDQWNVANGRYFQNMFRSTPSLNTSLAFGSNWNVRNALNMDGMFQDSNYGSDSTSSEGMCQWAYRKLYPSVSTLEMFLGSNCPNNSLDPNVTQRADQPISFCHDSCDSLYEQYYANQPERPNVLFLMTDQQRYDAIQYVQESLSRYDNALRIRTPNLDALLQSGAYFENAYTQCAVCAPARSTIRTGCTIERTGVQHNDVLTASQNGQLFQQRVQALEGLDQIMVEKLGYLSEYYGKWHIPDQLMYSKKDNNGTNNNIIHYNDYDYAKEEFYFLNDSDGQKNKRFLEYFHQQGLIGQQSIEDGQQYDTYTGYPYNPIQLDTRARYGSPTGTPLTTNRGFKIYEVTQPNVLGQFGLSEDYTPSHFTADVANKALQRLLQQSDPWFLTVSFHNPHPPMVPAYKHLEYYWNNRDQLFMSPNMVDNMTNTAYDNIINQIPDYQDQEKVQEWTALYYALIEEIDDEIGSLLASLGDKASNTLVIFTSDHGEMLGAHGKREKNNFHEESSRIPLFISWPGKILANTKVEEKVSNLDLFSTILDYAMASEHDHSDGRSLRPFIERRETNLNFDEDVVFAEWDFRNPPSGWESRKLLDLEESELDRDIDDRPAFLVRKGNKKLMMQKLAASLKLDMMFDLDNDQFEMYNLLGLNAMTASDSTIIQAEHMRCLLVDWMTRLDGEIGYYSDPLSNYGQGNGDISEIRDRQSWRAIGFWTSASDTGTLEMDKVAWTGEAFVRHEWLYMGTRLEQTVSVVSMKLSGSDASLFSIDTSVPIEFGMNSCVAIRVSFSSPASLSTTPVDTVLVIEWSELGFDGNPLSLSTSTIQLTMKDYDFDSQALGYPPPPTLAPTVSPAPTSTPTARPSTVSTMAPTVESTTNTASPSSGNIIPTVSSNSNQPIAEGETVGLDPDMEPVECGPDCLPPGAAANTERLHGLLFVVVIMMLL